MIWILQSRGWRQRGLILFVGSGRIDKPFEQLLFSLLVHLPPLLALLFDISARSLLMHRSSPILDRIALALSSTVTLLARVRVTHNCLNRPIASQHRPPCLEHLPNTPADWSTTIN